MERSGTIQRRRSPANNPTPLRPEQSTYNSSCPPFPLQLILTAALTATLPLQAVQVPFRYRAHGLLAGTLQAVKVSLVLITAPIQYLARQATTVRLNSVRLNRLPLPAKHTLKPRHPRIPPGPPLALNPPRNLGSFAHM